MTAESRSLAERSQLYREVLAEREEILRHKWFESEKAGRDIGFDAALASWTIRHSAQWRRQRRPAWHHSVGQIGAESPTDYSGQPG
jgi:hypothetical protein